MIAFFKVLIALLSRLLRGAAEALNEWAAPAPAAAPSPLGAGPVAAPEDWMSRAVPPPPAHWLAVVRSRAPHFRPADPRPPRERRETPSVSPVQHRMSRSEQAPALSVPDRRPAAPVLPFDPTRTICRPSPLPRPTAAPRLVRTVVEEQPPRTKRPVVEPVPSALELPRTPKSLEVFHAPDPSPEPLPAPTFSVVPLEVPVEAPASGGTGATTRAAVTVEKFQRSRRSSPPAPLEGFESFGRNPDERPLPPGLAGFARPEEAAPSLERPQAGWPALPEPRRDTPSDVCRRLLRELLQGEDLDREQRGLPWSA